MMNNFFKKAFSIIVFFLNTAQAEEHIFITDVINSEIIIGNNNSINKNISPPNGDIEINVGLAKLSSGEMDKILGGSEKDIDIKYEQSIVDKTIRIEPVIKSFYKEGTNYINAYLYNKPVYSMGTYFPDVILSSAPPLLEVKVINNSNKTVSIDQIILNVQKSIAYKTPLIIFAEPLSSFGMLDVIDEGNAKSESIDVKFNLYPRESEISNKPYKYNLTAKFKNGHTDLNFIDALSSEGVDTDFLLKSFMRNDERNKTDAEAIYPLENPKVFKKPLGKFLYTETCSEDETLKNHTDTLQSYINKTNKCRTYHMFVGYVVGEFKVNGTYEGVPVVKNGHFIARIQLTTPDGMGDSLSTIRLADVTFKDEGENYPIVINASRLLKPYEAEKYIFSLDSNKIGQHIFNVTTLLSGNKKYVSKPVDLFIFKPKAKETQKYFASGRSNPYQVITKPDLKVRSAPVITDNVIGNLSYGEKINVFKINKKKEIVAGQEGSWATIDYNSKFGYVFDSFIKPLQQDE